jgi:hypothetical protein
VKYTDENKINVGGKKMAASVWIETKNTKIPFSLFDAEWIYTPYVFTPFVFFSSSIIMIVKYGIDISLII